MECNIDKAKNTVLIKDYVIYSSFYSTITILFTTPLRDSEWTIMLSKYHPVVEVRHNAVVSKRLKQVDSQKNIF